MNDLGFIHRYIPPPHEGPASTTLLLLHGTGGNEDDLVPLGRELLPYAALLSPRGKVLEQGMPRFFRRLAEGVFDLDDLRVRTHELAAFLGKAREVYHLEGPLIAVGYSNGANIASSLMLQHPGLVSAAILFRPMIPFMPETPPALTGLRVFLSAGTQDPIVPRSQSEELAQLFTRCGATVSLSWHAGGHELGQDDVVSAQQWLGELQLS